MGFSGITQKFQVSFPGPIDVQIKTPIMKPRNYMKQPTGNMETCETSHNEHLPGSDPSVN